MKSSTYVLPTVLCALGLTLPAADASTLAGPRSSGTVQPDEAMIQQIEATLAPVKGIQRAEAVTVPLAFHVITNSRGEGSLSRDTINAQVEALNTAFRSVGVSFSLVKTDVTANDAWFKMAPGSTAEAEAKKALAVSPTTTLNLYSAGLSSGLLGWATLPWSSDTGSSSDGVVILYSTTPGGATAPYNLGATAAHEVGHWLGLYNTAGDCRTDSDKVSDTPMHKANQSCDRVQDTCPTRRGSDPIHNYMNLVPDACMTELTAGQGARITEMCATYRPDACGP